MAPRYPSIPEPTLEPTSLRDSILSIKQMLEILTGQRGNADYAAVMPGEFNSAVDGVNSAKVSKSGDTMTGNLTIQNIAPIVQLTETDTANTWFMVVDGSTISWRYNSLGTQNLTLDSSTLVASGNILANGGMLRSIVPSNFAFGLELTEGASGWTKYMRTTNDGSLQWVNDANTVIIASLSDAGELDWVGSAWTAYTPTVVVAGGAGSATGRYKRLGKTVAIVMDITISTGGTSCTPTLPAGMTALGGCYLVGREVAFDGRGWIAQFSTSHVLLVRSADAATAVTAGHRYQLSGVFDIA